MQRKDQPRVGGKFAKAVGPSSSNSTSRRVKKKLAKVDNGLSGDPGTPQPSTATSSQHDVPSAPSKAPFSGVLQKHFCCDPLSVKRRNPHRVPSFYVLLSFVRVHSGYSGPLSPIIFRRTLSLPASFLDKVFRQASGDAIGRDAVKLLRESVQQAILACKFAVNGTHDPTLCACGEYDFSVKEFSVDDAIRAFIDTGSAVVVRLLFDLVCRLYAMFDRQHSRFEFDKSRGRPSALIAPGGAAVPLHCSLEMLRNGKQPLSMFAFIVIVFQ